MLDKFIKMQFENFNSNRDNFYTKDEISSLEAQSVELEKKIAKLDKDLGNQVDELIGGIIRAYGNVYFQEGFKEGLILFKEMQELLKSTN